MKKKKNKIIKFKDIKNRIIEELEKRYDDLKIDEATDLVDGFMEQIFRMELSDQFLIGGRTIPMIMLLGKKSGRIYFFALKALLPDIEV